MSEQTPDQTTDTATDPSPDPDLAGQGLSATATTADQMHPGEPGIGTGYGDPGGPATADREISDADAPAEDELPDDRDGSADTQ